MFSRYKPLYFSLFLLLAVTVESWAAKLQPLAEIEHVAYLYAMDGLQAEYDMPQIVIRPLDKRLRLQSCSGELTAFSQQARLGLGSQTIGVRCDDSAAWTVYVQMTVKLMKQVVVAKQALPSKHVLTASDLRMKQVDIGQLRHSYVVEPKQLIGQQLKYPVAMGKVLSQSFVKPQKLVRRGESIVLIARAGTMEVKMNGTALADASIGQKVKVKNSSSKRVVEGVVDGPGIVRIQL